MPRNISFALTTAQVKSRQKTVTRRFGWWQLKAGDRLIGVEKSMGLKKGEKVKPICEIEVTSVRKERLDLITKEDCIKEGFPELHPKEFVEMIITQYACKHDDLINRIEFRYI